MPKAGAESRRAAQGSLCGWERSPGNAGAGAGGGVDGSVGCVGAAYNVFQRHKIDMEVRPSPSDSYPRILFQITALGSLPASLFKSCRSVSPTKLTASE